MTFDGLSLVIGGIVGFIIGLLVALGLYFVLIRQLQSRFVELSSKTQREVTGDFLELAKSNFSSERELQKATLESERQLISLKIAELDEQLGNVEKLVSEFEEARGEKIGALKDELGKLTTTTENFTKLLTNSQQRGSWGERIAKTLLESDEFKDITYTEQELQGNIRPDFTFKLPDNHKINMDSKFAFDNYKKYIESENETERKILKDKFIKSVEDHIKEVKKRNYITPDTLDFVLVFIPNEAVYRFIYEEGNDVVQNALKDNIILCSPTMLYVTLLLIRQAVRNFQLGKSSKDILKALKGFKNEWEKYLEETEDLRKSLEKAQKSFDSLTGVRQRKLDSAINEINKLQIPDEIQSTELN